MSLLLRDVKNHYRLLQHDGYYSQLHAQDKQTNKQLSRKLVQGVDEVVAWIRENNGKGDLYIGRNPRTPDGKVAFLSNICIDIDPIRKKDTASTPEQLHEATMAGKWLVGLPEYSEAILACSGNGVHLYWSLKEHWDITQEQVKEFEADIRKKIEGRFNVEVDAIHDDPRLVKIIGTQATKGAPNERRVSKFMSPINWSRLFDDRVCQRLHSYSKAQQPGVPAAVSKEAGVDRSELDYGLALRLKRDGASKDSIRSFLRSHGYRAPERPDDIERIINKVFTADTGEPGYGEEEKHVEIYSPSTHGAEFLRRLDRDGEEKSELSTGFPTLDKYTGGLKKGSVWVVGARTGIGKTSFSITVANHLLADNKKVLIFSTEMDWVDAFGRFASIGTGISLHTLTNARRELTSEDKKRLREYANDLKSKSLYVVEEPEPSLRVVSEEISRVRPDVFIFDHIQRVANARDKRYLELSKFIKGLNTLCRQNDCAAIVNSQLNRIAEQETPALSHLKECGALEEEAHCVVLLSALSHSPTGEATVLADVAKNRGPKGKVELKFEPITAKFMEVVS